MWHPTSAVAFVSMRVSATALPAVFTGRSPRVSWSPPDGDLLLCTTKDTDKHSSNGNSTMSEKETKLHTKMAEPVEADTSKSRTASPQDGADFDTLRLNHSLGGGITDSAAVERSKTRQRSRVTNGSRAQAWWSAGPARRDCFLCSRSAAGLELS
jgi:hypothetical protein